MTSTHGEPGPAEPSADQRLDSWKEIATYLKRGERTVRRWEAQEGLPVHRHLHTKRASVYAFRSEIDAWWNNGHQRLDTALDTANETAPLRPRLLRWPVAIAAGVLLTATMALGLWFLARPGLDFEARDWVLIADFENQTGGAIADGTVEYALAHALGESRFVNVVPRARVVDTLGLMRRPPETAVDAAVGREIALRDGGIRAILSGRVDKLDTTYALSAVLVEPATGRTVASVREEAAGDSEFLPAVHRLSNRVRARLGEALADIERSARALEKVTTPSLSALQLFSEADGLIPQPAEQGRRRGRVTAAGRGGGSGLCVRLHALGPYDPQPAETSHRVPAACRTSGGARGARERARAVFHPGQLPRHARSG